MWFKLGFSYVSKPNPVKLSHERVNVREVRKDILCTYICAHLIMFTV